MEGVNRRMDRGGGGHVVKRALLFCSTTARAINLARVEGSIWERDAEERPRVRLISSNPATKGDESKTRENIEAASERTATPKGFRASVSSFFPFLPYYYSHESGTVFYKSAAGSASLRRLGPSSAWTG